MTNEKIEKTLMSNFGHMLRLTRMPKRVELELNNV
jgi:hypothetical protein